MLKFCGVLGSRRRRAGRRGPRIAAPDVTNSAITSEGNSDQLSSRDSRWYTLSQN